LVKVEGQLTGERATLRLWLYKQEDCRAEYSFKVVQVDGQGRQLLSNSHLLQQTWDGDHGRITQVDSGAVWSPVVAMNILLAVQKIDNKLSQACSAANDPWQPRDQALENRIEDKIASLENRLENELYSLENRLEDKMASFERSVQNDIVKLHSKLGDIIADQMSAVKSELTTAVARQESTLETTMKSSISDNLATLRKDLEENILDKIDLEAAYLHSDLNATTIALSSVENSLSLFQVAATNGKTDCVQNVEETLRNISLASQDSTQTLKAQLSSMKQSLQQNIQQIATDRNNSHMTGCSDHRDVLFETQANVTKSLQSIMTDSLTLKSCEKNR
ncbi:hypothetical protein ElyMa_004755300, partial [Elysia marginata]